MKTGGLIGIIVAVVCVILLAVMFFMLSNKKKNQAFDSNSLLEQKKDIKKAPDIKPQEQENINTNVNITDAALKKIQIMNKNLQKHNITDKNISITPMFDGSDIKNKVLLDKRPLNFNNVVNYYNNNYNPNETTMHVGYSTLIDGDLPPKDIEDVKYVIISDLENINFDMNNKTIFKPEEINDNNMEVFLKNLDKNIKRIKIVISCKSKPYATNNNITAGMFETFTTEQMQCLCKNIEKCNKIIDISNRSSFGAALPSDYGETKYNLEEALKKQNKPIFYTRLNDVTKQQTKDWTQKSVEGVTYKKMTWRNVPVYFKFQNGQQQKINKKIKHDLIKKQKYLDDNGKEVFI